jgi:hypothetical protein
MELGITVFWFIAEIRGSIIISSDARIPRRRSHGNTNFDIIFSILETRALAKQLFATKLILQYCTKFLGVIFAFLANFNHIFH